jgi:hypothetical protein
VTLSTEEVWGGTNLSAHTTGFYKSFFQANHLIDLAPDKLVPTWRNGRSGAALISKRLDRFLIAEDFLSGIGLYRTWVEYPYISDHAPIVLQLELPPLYKSFPFKLNPYWLQFQDYRIIGTGFVEKTKV